MKTETIQIDPRVALFEEQLLVDHYRSRALALAQRVFEAEGIIEQLNARIDELRIAVEREA